MSEDDDNPPDKSVLFGPGDFIPPVVRHLFEYPWVREAREGRLRIAGRLAAFTGMWGILSGFALFDTRLRGEKIDPGLLPESPRRSSPLIPLHPDLIRPRRTPLLTMPTVARWKSSSCTSSGCGE